MKAELVEQLYWLETNFPSVSGWCMQHMLLLGSRQNLVIKKLMRRNKVRASFPLWPMHYGPIHLLNTRKYCVNTCKYWDNTYKYWANTWKMCSPASVILTSIVTLLVSFEAVLVYFKAHCRKITLKLTSNVDIYRNSLQNCFKTYKYCDNTCEYYTCRWTHFSSIGSILASITTILTSIFIMLASIEEVNTP